jgi:hypothetical protein
MSLSQLVKEFEDYSERKLFEIHMAASMVELNLLKAQGNTTGETTQNILRALEDVRYIKNELTKNNFRTKPETGEF